MRSIDAGTQAALAAPVVRKIAMVRMHFDGGIVAWHTGTGEISFQGYAYSGIGSLGSIGAAKEDTDIRPASITATISGIPTANISLALSEPFLGRKAYVHIALLDDADQVDIISRPPFLLFYGSMDAPTIEMGETASVTIPINSRLSDWERRRTNRYTNAEQQALHPGDRGLEFIEQMAAREVIWPGAGFKG